MRAYDAATKTYENQDLIANRVSFACLDVSGPMPETPYMARTNCSSGLRAQIQFQSCWNGIDLYKSDQSHVAYMSEIDNGDCPPGYPYLLPHLFYEIIYAVNNIDQSDGGLFVLSNGDVTGFAFHGDFQNGWNETVLTQAIAQCINTNDGSITDCAPLAASVDPYFNINCPEQPQLVNETVKGLLNALPGCNPPTGGPARAAAAICPIVPNLNYIPNTDDFTRYIPKPGDIRAGWQYLGCSTDNSTIRPLTGVSYSNTSSMTIESCTAFCHTNLYPLAGMEYGTVSSPFLPEKQTLTTYPSNAIAEPPCPRHNPSRTQQLALSIPITSVAATISNFVALLRYYKYGRTPITRVHQSCLLQHLETPH